MGSLACQSQLSLFVRFVALIFMLSPVADFALAPLQLDSGASYKIKPENLRGEGAYAIGAEAGDAYCQYQLASMCVGGGQRHHHHRSPPTPPPARPPPGT